MTTRLFCYHGGVVFGREVSDIRLRHKENESIFVIRKPEVEVTTQKEKIMAVWNISFTHGDGTRGTGGITAFNGFGVGNSGTTPRVQCSCGFIHTFTGSQASSIFASGSGPGSVAPGNDRPNESDEEALDAGPTWDAEISNPIEGEEVETEAPCATEPNKDY